MSMSDEAGEKMWRRRGRERRMTLTKKEASKAGTFGNEGRGGTAGNEDGRRTDRGEDLLSPGN